MKNAFSLMEILVFSQKITKIWSSVQVMTQCRIGNKPLPKMTKLADTNICITWLQYFSYHNLVWHISNRYLMHFGSAFDVFQSLGWFLPLSLSGWKVIVIDWVSVCLYVCPSLHLFVKVTHCSHNHQICTKHASWDSIVVIEMGVIDLDLHIHFGCTHHW